MYARKGRKNANGNSRSSSSRTNRNKTARNVQQPPTDVLLAICQKQWQQQKRQQLHTHIHTDANACLLITVFENSKSPSAAAAVASAAEKAEQAESINNNKNNKRCDKVQHVACATQCLPHAVGVQSTHAPRNRQQQFIMTSGVLSTQRATWRLFRLSKYPAKGTLAEKSILHLNAWKYK